MTTPEAEERIEVIVPDDHPLFRRGIVAALARRTEFEVAGEAEDGAEALELIDQGAQIRAKVPAGPPRARTETDEGRRLRDAPWAPMLRASCRQ